MKMEQFLKKQQLNLHQFSKICGVQWCVFYKGYNSKFISLWLAKIIVENSDGLITYDDFKGKKPKAIKRKIPVSRV